MRLLRVVPYLAVTFALVWGSGPVDVTYDRVSKSSAHAVVCLTVTRSLSNWRGHLVFERPISKLELYTADLVETLHGGQEYVIKGKSYNSHLDSGDDVCIKFLIREVHPTPPKAQFYIEGYNAPSGSGTYTHAPTTPIPIPSGGGTNSHNAAQILWSHPEFDPRDPLAGLDPLKEGAFDEDSMSVVKDPAGGGANVLRIYYEKGQYVKTRPHRGAQFYSKPLAPRETLTFSYDIYFSPGFPFVKGGKLPGLYGGDQGCSGGRHDDDCFSTRLMWRTDGDGEVYAYLPSDQVSDFCSASDVHCNFQYGNSLGRGSWRFKTGVWQNIAQEVKLNTPGHKNGEVTMWFNGQRVFHKQQLNFRNSASILISGIFFSTFFGGSSPDWAPTADCYTYYKSFVLSDNPHAHIVG